MLKINWGLNVRGYGRLGIQLVYLLNDYASDLGEHLFYKKLLELFFYNQHPNCARLTIVDAEWDEWQGTFQSDTFARLLVHCS